MKALLSTVRLQAQQAQSRTATTRLAQVTSYNPGTHAVKVTIQPDGIETGWLPLASMWVGNGWGMFSPPSPGDMVQVEFAEGDKDSGLAVARLFSDVDRPLPCPSGEFWLVHKSGSMLKFHNDGSVEIKAHTEMRYSAEQHTFSGPVTMDQTLAVTSTISGTGGIAITGVPAGGSASASFEGDIRVTGGDVRADDISLKHHRTAGVQTGAGTSGEPTP